MGEAEFMEKWKAKPAEDIKAQLETLQDVGRLDEARPQEVAHPAPQHPQAALNSRLSRPQTPECLRACLSMRDREQKSMKCSLRIVPWGRAGSLIFPFLLPVVTGQRGRAPRRRAPNVL